MRSRRFDTAIRNGTIVDGLRTPRYKPDIGIRRHIAYIGRIFQPGNAAVIEAKGLIVAPGIIDLHTHYDSQIFWAPYCTISAWHGVTSVVVGNCGFGFAPCRPQERDRAMPIMTRNEAVRLETMKAGMPCDWESFPEFTDSLDRMPKGVNVMSTDFIVDHVRTHQVIDVEEAPRRLSTYSAQAAGLKGRAACVRARQPILSSMVSTRSHPCRLRPLTTSPPVSGGGSAAPRGSVYSGQRRGNVCRRRMHRRNAGPSASPRS